MCSDETLLDVLRYIQNQLNETGKCKINPETAIETVNEVVFQIAVEELKRFNYISCYVEESDVTGDTYEVTDITERGMQFIKKHM